MKFFLDTFIPEHFPIHVCPLVFSELLKVVRSLLDGFVTEPLIASTATGQTIELRGAHTITSITIAIQPVRDRSCPACV